MDQTSAAEGRIEVVTASGDLDVWTGADYRFSMDMDLGGALAIKHTTQAVVTEDDWLEWRRMPAHRRPNHTIGDHVDAEVIDAIYAPGQWVKIAVHRVEGGV